MVTILIPRALLGARLHGYRISRSLPFILKSIQFSVIPASAIASNNVTLQKGFGGDNFFLLRLTPHLRGFAACRF